MDKKLLSVITKLIALFATILSIVFFFIDDKIILLTSLILAVFASITNLSLKEFVDLIGPSYPNFNKIECFFNKITNDDGIFKLKHKKKSGKKRLYISINKGIEFSSKLEQEFIFAKTKKKAIITGEINSKTFATSKWRANKEEKIKRNHSYIKRNKWTFSLLKNKKGIFYATCSILPITTEGYERYTRGLVSDNKFPARFVAKKESEIRAIIIFMIGVIRNKRSVRKIPCSQEAILMIIRHLSLMAKNMKIYDRDIPILLQNNRSSIIKPLSRIGFETRHEYQTLDEEQVMEIIARFIK